MADDFYHSFRILRNSDGSTCISTIEIKSFHDLLDTIANMRYFMNSRFANTAFIALNYFGGLTLVRVVNAACLSLFFIAFSLIIFKKFCSYSLLLSATSFFIFIPVWKLTCTWPSASMNYTLGACSLIAFLIGFYRTRNKSADNFTIIFTSACAVFCGICHEGLSAPLLAALAWYTFGFAKSCSPRNYKALILYMACLLIPLIFLLTAPGMASRISNVADSGGIIRRSVIMTWVFLLRFLPLWILYLFAVYRRRKSIFKSFLFVYSICNICLALGTDGMWGGGYFYAGLSMLIFSMYTFQDVAFKYPICIRLASLSVLGYVVVSSTYLYANVSDIIGSVVSEGSDHKIVCVDEPDGDNVTYTILAHSLPRPLADTNIRSTLYSKLYNTPKFEVILNQIKLPFDKKELENLPKIPSDAAPVWKLYKGVSVIQLPENWVVQPRSTQQGISNQQEYDIVEPCNCVSEIEVLKHLLRRPSIYASMCSVCGVNYWLVSDGTAQLDEIRLDIVHRVTGEKCHFDLKRP